jgi:DNA-binding winged helix-turn-helix (wHTH) protein/tetratricopeptide (TPR) repeat protein
MNELSTDRASSGDLAQPHRETGKYAYSFAGLRLEPDGTLYRGSTVVHLPPKELTALRLLLAYASQIVTPLQMRKALWGEIHVSADSVAKCVSSLRARLQLEDCIQTVYKRGYRFSAMVASIEAVPGAPLPRLAVAPFTLGPGVPQYLGPAVAEETAAHVTHSTHPVASVLAQDSVFTLWRRGLMAHQIGEALRADFVLTGQIRALPAHLRLSAEMIRVKDGVQVWAEDILIDRNLPAGLEMELAERLNFRLNAVLPLTVQEPGPAQTDDLSIAASAEPAAFSAPLQEPESDRTRRMRAYEIFQSARYDWRNLQRHRLQQSVEHLVHAVELDPSLTGARIDLVNLCVTQAIYGFMAPNVSAATARHAAGAVTDFSGRGAAILPALGWISFHYDFDLPAALRSFSRSAHLPHDPWVTRARSFFALSRHRFTEALALLRSAIDLDPFSPWLHGRLAWALHLAGEAKESLDLVHRALEQFPDDSVTCFFASIILAWNGESERAAEIARTLEARIPHLDLAIAAHAYALARSGHPDEARSALEQIEWRARERFAITGFNAAVYLELGAPYEAVQVLQTSMQSRCPWFFQILADPRLQPLHGRPEFEQLRAVFSGIEAQAESDSGAQVTREDY